MPLSEIIGQGKVVDILTRAIDSKRIVHAYLFLGPPNTGKKAAALEFAKTLLKIEKPNHPDLFVISKGEKEKEISIDRVRELKHRFSLKPFEAEMKACIIEDAEDMSEEAANGLLKILEEPSGDTVFILTAQDINSLFATIVSRCQVIRFKPLSKDETARILPKDSGDASIIDEFINNPQEILSKDKDYQLKGLDVLLSFFRDALIYKFVKDPNLVINIDKLKAVEEISEKTGPAQLQQCIRDIIQAKLSLESNANTKLVMKVLLEQLWSR